MGFTYRDAGVDVEGGNRFVSRIAPLVKSTFSDRVITGIGGFGALLGGDTTALSAAPDLEVRGRLRISENTQAASHVFFTHFSCCRRPFLCA